MVDWYKTDADEEYVFEGGVVVLFWMEVLVEVDLWIRKASPGIRPRIAKMA